ncbi:MAG: DNA methyltransferase [Burkholderiales bacterium]|nr:DNA methyltransferase [Burkholderiales bacterium]
MVAVASVTAYDLAVTAPAKPAGTKQPPRRINGIAVYEQEFWTSRQRQANPLHEVSYRGCFKPQLPAYFIDRLSKPGDIIYDPFSGRGTTTIEAALLGRNVIANDVNPLSVILTRPRLEVPLIANIDVRLRAIKLTAKRKNDIDLSMFYHPDTERQLLNLRAYLVERHNSGAEDAADRWIRMVATNRLTGHSPGFFSAYTLPPNQAVSAESQVKINEKTGKQPEYRDVPALILRKSMQLQSDINAAARWRLQQAAANAHFLQRSAAQTLDLPENCVQLTVTSPPFLNVVHYAKDNWLRCWFNDLDAEAIGAGITMATSINDWSAVMLEVLHELYRITRPKGWVAFEVGEVQRGSVNLDEAVVPLGAAAGFRCEAILINTQKFTKTSNIWGVGNNERGTNSNRIVMLQKPA